VSRGDGRLRAQVRAELQLVARNGEQLLLTMGIPLLLLVFFSLVDVLPTDAATRSGDPVDFLAPGVIALAVMSTAMVSLGIATGFERSYLVLKRLGATPLGRGRLVVAKIVSVLVVELVQLAVLIPVSFALGWRPSGAAWPLAIVAVVVGTTAFAGIGLTLAGTLRGEINLAAQNGIYLVLLLLGGMVIPFEKLPTPIRAVSRVLPSGALADVMRDALSGTGDRPGLAWVVLAAWAVLSPAVARRTFRFE
jgi:ABC-2 type transport system permease protein